MFQITEYTEVTLATFTKREENHGDEKVAAISVTLELTGANTLLDAIDADGIVSAMNGDGSRTLVEQRGDNWPFPRGETKPAESGTDGASSETPAAESETKPRRGRQAPAEVE